jgi:uncharacterized protein (TIGR00369 family)
MSSLPIEVEQLSGLETLRSWIAERKRPPMGETLDFDLVEAEKGRVVFEATPTPRCYSPLGFMHGGWAATLLDSACGCAAHSMLDAGQSYSTAELKVAYHRPITAAAGKLRAEAKIVSIGRRVAFTEGRLADANGRIYASATSTLVIGDADARRPAG